MKKLAFILIFLPLFSFSVISQEPEIENIIHSVRENYVPDKRICIYEVTSQINENSLVLKGRISDSNVYQQLLQTIKSKGIAFTDSIQLMPENTIGLKHWGIVPLSAIFIRSAPDFTAEITTQATLGTPVKILDKRAGWLLIQTPDKYIGWTNTTIRMLDKNELSVITKKRRVIVTDFYSTIYKSPSGKSERIMEVLKGNILTLENEKNHLEFSQVSLPDGKKGFIPKKSVIKFSEWQKSIRLTGENVVETAKDYLGLPYLWGGTSPRGFDCSGFTKTVYFMYGKILPRDASQQYFIGEKIDISEGYGKLQKGDLLFFGRKSVSNPNEHIIVHVAIYAGGKKFIHSSGYVRIDSLDPQSEDYDEYNAGRLLGARRIIGTNPENVESIFLNNWYN